MNSDARNASAERKSLRGKAKLPQQVGEGLADRLIVIDDRNEHGRRHFQYSLLRPIMAGPRSALDL